MNYTAVCNVIWKGPTRLIGLLYSLVILILRVGEIRWVNQLNTSNVTVNVNS